MKLTSLVRSRITIAVMSRSGSVIVREVSGDSMRLKTFQAREYCVEGENLLRERSGCLSSVVCAAEPAGIRVSFGPQVSVDIRGRDVKMMKGACRRRRSNPRAYRVPIRGIRPDFGQVGFMPRPHPFADMASQEFNAAKLTCEHDALRRLPFRPIHPTLARLRRQGDRFEMAETE
ncbi:hypothetical protein [Burkholderia metallica]|uniref:hypothetical protein n=1 Tax=Burkholderia metallica TaxID=488729 RepID=UPI00158F4606|nr:hypothetical protein [Burkholderia metallica]